MRGVVVVAPVSQVWQHSKAHSQQILRLLHPLREDGLVQDECKVCVERSFAVVPSSKRPAQDGLCDGLQSLCILFRVKDAGKHANRFE